MDQRLEGNGRDESASSAENARASREFLASNLARMTDSEILKQTLSPKSVILTASSFGRLSQTASSRPDLQQLNQIGAGLQGAIFEQVGKPLALKKESPGNEKLPSNLYHEYKIHCDVSAAFEHYQSTNGGIHIPKPFELISRKENSGFWDEILPKTPEDHRVPGNLVIMERILPLPKVVRKALISQFCAPEQHLDSAGIEALLNYPENKHCLVRIYLGKENGTINHEIPLRNFPLCLESMEQVGVETLPLANAMGKAYATLIGPRPSTAMMWSLCLELQS